MARVGTRKLRIEVDGDEYTAEASVAEFLSAAADGDFVSFEDAASGGARDYRFHTIFAQDHATGSLWRVMWDNPGDEITVTLMPYGNDTPSASQPHYTATVVVGEPDGTLIGGEANKSTSAAFTTEVSWECLARPTPVTAP